MKGRKRNDDYVLTQDEYNTMCDLFYQVQAMTRLLHQMTEKNTHNNNRDIIDAGNVLAVVEEKLQVMEPLLGK